MPRRADPLVIRHAGLGPGKRAQSTAERIQREDERTMRNRKSAAESRKKKTAQEKHDRDKMVWQEKRIADLCEALIRKNNDLNRLHELSGHQHRHMFGDDEVYISDLLRTTRYDDSHPLTDSPDGQSPNPPVLQNVPSRGTTSSSDNSGISPYHAAPMFPVDPSGYNLGSQLIAATQEGQLLPVQPPQGGITGQEVSLSALPPLPASLEGYVSSPHMTMPNTDHRNGSTHDAEHIGTQVTSPKLFMPVHQDPLPILYPEEDTPATTSHPSTGSSSITFHDTNFNGNSLPGSQGVYPNLFDEFWGSLYEPMGTIDLSKDCP